MMAVWRQVVACLWAVSTGWKSRLFLSFTLRGSFSCHSLGCRCDLHAATIGLIFSGFTEITVRIKIRVYRCYTGCFQSSVYFISVTEGMQSSKQKRWNVAPYTQCLLCDCLGLQSLLYSSSVNNHGSGVIWPVARVCRCHKCQHPRRLKRRKRNVKKKHTKKTHKV